MLVIDQKSITLTQVLFLRLRMPRAPEAKGLTVQSLTVKRATAQVITVEFKSKYSSFICVFVCV